MTGLPRFVSRSLPKFILATALSGIMPAMLRAQDAPTPMAMPATTAPASVSKELKSAVENFWYYSKVALYDLANAEGQKIVSSGAQPLDVLVAFEQVAAEHQDAARMDQLLVHFRDVPQEKEIATQIIALVSDGHRARRSDPKYIKEHLGRLTGGDRAYGLAMGRLYESGELAVPFLIDALRDPSRSQYQTTYRKALRDLGRNGLNPLVAATEMKDWQTLGVVIGVLGDLGYDAAVPYVARAYESPESPASIKAAAAEALAKLGAVRGGTVAASDSFFALAESIYNGRSAITADIRFPSANIWYYGEQGLTRTEVPHAIFNDIMAMRASEYTLKLGGSRSDDALALWLAANYRREADLVEGTTDATRPEGYPNGHYWGVEAGSRYLNMALARAIKDHNSEVAFRSIRSLQEIAGQSNLFIGASSRPLINAMQYPDRKVRFEAAFALAAALPQTAYEGQQRVVPLLAEAISQTGQPSVIVVMSSQDAVNKMVDSLKTEGFAAAGAPSAPAAMSIAGTLPAVDVILVSEDIGQGHVDEVFGMAADNSKLAGAARLVMTRSTASVYDTRKVSDPMLDTTTATDAAGLKPAIEAARARAGALPLGEEAATDYATRAGELMLKVGISRGQVYDLMPAKAALLSSLSDTRPAIVMLGGQCLGLLNDKDAQTGLLTTALDEKSSDEVKISLFKSLAINAKFFGNKLDGAQVQSLEKVVADAPSLEVRSAAAEARGAMNLPADQAKSLIVKQSKT